MEINEITQNISLGRGFGMIKGLQKTTLIDFPGKIACTIFIGGCNMRCGYCYNSDLVLRQEALPTISKEEFLDFLDKRKKFLEGVCITGGEPTMHKDLPELCKSIKKLGFAVKLDTNGTNPEMLELLIKSKLLDYIAMDVKASLESYGKVCNTAINIENVKRSIEIIKNSGIDYEFRTTLVPDIINVEEMKKIGHLIAGARKYFLQQFRASPSTMDAKYNNMESLGNEKIIELRKAVVPFVNTVGIRNADVSETLVNSASNS